MSNACRPYSPAEIRRVLPPGTPPRRLIVVEEIGSTQDAARRLAEDGAPHGSLVLADRQLQGRGRNGRTWHSPTGAGIWMSVVLRPELSPSRASLLALVAGVAVAEAIEAVCGVRLELKWPNDLVAADRKAGGILVDTSSRGDTLAWCVVGIGVNVRGGAELFPRALGDVATSLAALGARDLTRETAIGAVMASLLRSIELLDRGGSAGLLEAYALRDALAGRTVWVDTGDGSVVSGLAAGIDPDGALRVVTAFGPRCLRVGSVVRIEP